VCSSDLALTAGFLREPELAAILAEIAPDAGARIERMVRGRSESPLAGLVAGSLDLDKIEYLNRDALFCGVPYGTVDVDRLIHALTLLTDPETGRTEIGVHEKGLSALESLLFAKYQMFRNVYWHHAIRAATALFKRTIQDAVEAQIVTPRELIGKTDEGLLSLLESRAAESRERVPAAARVAERWIHALRYRRLLKRAIEIPGDRLRDLPFGEWFYSDPGLRARLEDQFAVEMGLPTGSVLLDYPEKPRMMGLDLLLRERSGEVKRLPESGRAGLIDLPRVADGLYHTARVFRVFTLERRELDENSVLRILRLDADTLRKRVESKERLLQAGSASA
jgi:HD superfamily phosphohydrolase